MAIKILDKLTSEQIAAGEVIENPASAVKELVENALDAGASRVEIKISGGGKNLIKVIDNGSGIEPEDLPLAFQRFATSKLSALHDLDVITSLGFRGEALPSIAAVAKVTMTTRLRGALSGSRISMAGGQLVAQEEVGAPEGTVVEVKDLFFNTPGRLKFLRSDAAETARITALVTDLALAHPGVSFNLANERAVLLQTSGDGNLLHTVGAVYGSEIASGMLPVAQEDETEGLRLSGYITQPHLSRSSRRYITVMINGRTVKSPMLTGALERGYGEFLPRQRYPAAVIHLHMLPHFLDVNVHPAKTEVRFQYPEKVKDLVYRGVRSALYRPLSPFREQPERDSDTERPFTGPAGRIWQEGARQYSLEEDIQKKDFHHFGTADSFSPGQAEQVAEHLSEAATESPQWERGEAATSLQGSCRLIGQFLHSYLVAVRGHDLLLIDQHAAHERVLYETLQGVKEKQGQGAQLTMPLEIEVPPAWREPLNEMLPYLEETGFKVESFGDNSYIIRSVPFSHRGDMGKNELLAMLEELATGDSLSGERVREQIRKTVACHRAIKAHQPLSRWEMERLLEEWEKTPGCSYCPHGRPAVLSFSSQELEKGFRRKGGNHGDG